MSTSSDDAETFAITYCPNSQSPSNAALTDLTPGQQLRCLNVTMRKARFATIRGRVIAPAGASVSIGLMTKSENGTSSSSRGFNDKDGKFELFGIPPGQVYLTGSYTNAGLRYNAQMMLDVGSGDINGIELRPLSPQQVTGQVRIDGQATVKLSEVQITLRSGGNNAGIAPKDDGTLLFRELEPSTYRVETGRTQPATS